MLVVRLVTTKLVSELTPGDTVLTADPPLGHPVANVESEGDGVRIRLDGTLETFLVHRKTFVAVLTYPDR
jgi:hypothetical protein